MSAATEHHVLIIANPSGYTRWRAECICGWYEDWITLLAAELAGSLHLARHERPDGVGIQSGESGLKDEG